MKKRSSPLPSHFTTPAQSPGFLLWKVSNAWQRKLRAALAPLGLTHSQFVVLATATWFEPEEPLTQTRLSSLTGIDPMTTSQIVRTLVSSQLLERCPHPTDPRANSITVTQAGRSKARKAVVVVEAADAQFFAPLGDGSKHAVEIFTTLLQDDSKTPGN